MSLHEYRDAIDPRCTIGKCSINNCLYPSCLPKEEDPHPKGAWVDNEKVAVLNCYCAFCTEREFRKDRERFAR